MEMVDHLQTPLSVFDYICVRRVQTVQISRLGVEDAGFGNWFAKLDPGLQYWYIDWGHFFQYALKALPLVKL